LLASQLALRKLRQILKHGNSRSELKVQWISHDHVSTPWRKSSSGVRATKRRSTCHEFATLAPIRYRIVFWYNAALAMPKHSKSVQIPTKSPASLADNFFAFSGGGSQSLDGLLRRERRRLWPVRLNVDDAVEDERQFGGEVVAALA
jgi:hypothetical protein